MSELDNTRHEGIFTVERILEKKLFKGKVKYLIKWREFKVAESTWEPVENLTECASMIEAFEKRVLKEQGRHQKKVINLQEKPQSVRFRKKSLAKLDAAAVPSGKDTQRARKSASGSRESSMTRQA